MGVDLNALTIFEINDVEQVVTDDHAVAGTETLGDVLGKV